MLISSFCVKFRKTKQKLKIYKNDNNDPESLALTQQAPRNKKSIK